MNPAFRKLIYFIPALLWALFILFATLASTSTLSHLHLGDLVGWDKPIHILLFGTQSWLLSKALQQSGITGKSPLLLVWVLVSMYGVTTETLQALITSSRTFDYFDLIANTTGTTLVYFFFKRKQR